MSSDEIVIDVQNLSKRYEIYDTPRDRLKQLVLPRLYQVVDRVGRIMGLKLSNIPHQYFNEFLALHNVSFKVRKGETLGIIGRNGSGKSTLLQLICNTATSTSGNIIVNGRVSALLELGSGFNPEYSGHDNIFLNGQILGLSKDEIKARYEEILEFADIGDFINQPVKTYSSGMAVRLAFSVAIHVRPELLIIDEALAVGDMLFQLKCFSRLRQMKAQGVSILFVSHDLAAVRSFCDKAIYLKNGKMVGYGEAPEVVKKYEFDCFEERSRLNIPSSENTGWQQKNKEKEIDDGFRLIAQFENKFIQRSRIGHRQGSNRLAFISCEFFNNDGEFTDVLSPGEEVTAMFLVRANSDYRGDIHLSLQIQEKNGAQVAVVRDSWFERTIQIPAGQYLTAKLKFTPYFRHGEYYATLGLLCFPEGSKYINGVFNIDQMEIADLVEIGVCFSVTPMERHPIPVPVLIEAKLEMIIESNV